MLRALLIGLTLALSFASNSEAQQPTRQPSRAASWSQRQFRDELPSSLIARFDREGRLRIRLIDLISNFRPVSFQDPGVVASLKDFAVSLTDAAGVTHEARADDTGLVLFDELMSEAVAANAGQTGPEEGVYALVVANADRQKHSALAVYLESSDEEEVAPFPLTMATVKEERVLRNLRGYLGVNNASSVDLSGKESMNVTDGLYYEIPLQPDSSLVGKILVPPRSDGKSWGSYNGVNITILKDGREIARTQTDEKGEFSVSAMSPGVYGIIAAGKIGYCAFAFQAVESGQQAVRPISFRAALNQNQGGLTVLMTPPSMLPSVADAITNSYADSGGSASPNTIAGPGTGGATGTGGGGGASGAAASGGSGSLAGGGQGGGTTGGGGGGIPGGGTGGLAGLSGLGGTLGAALSSQASGGGEVASPAIP